MSKVVVTGGSGFVGYHVCKKLLSEGYNVISLQRKTPELYRWVDGICYMTGVDLTCYNLFPLLKHEKPKFVVHLAGNVGGIGYNRICPADIALYNMKIGHMVLEGVLNYYNWCCGNSLGSDYFRGLINVGTVCSYPKRCKVPFKEEDIWKGFPEETNAGYGIVKRAIMQSIGEMRKQYSFPGVTLIPTNMFGECDDFDDTTSHVIPAIIKKIVKDKAAGINGVELFGTGKPSRDFLYAGNFASAISLLMNKLLNINALELPYYMNVSDMVEYKIVDIAKKICDLLKYPFDKVKFNKKYPDGQPRRLVSSSLFKKHVGTYPAVSFDDALKRTIYWYVREMHDAKR